MLLEQTWFYCTTQNAQDICHWCHWVYECLFCFNMHGEHVENSEYLTLDTDLPIQMPEIYWQNKNDIYTFLKKSIKMCLECIHKEIKSLLHKQTCSIDSQFVKFLCCYKYFINYNFTKCTYHTLTVNIFFPMPTILQLAGWVPWCTLSQGDARGSLLLSEELTTEIWVLIHVLCSNLTEKHCQWYMYGIDVLYWFAPSNSVF